MFRKQKKIFRWCVTLSVLIHGALLLFVVRSKPPVKMKSTPVPITFVELKKDKPKPKKSVKSRGKKKGAAGKSKKSKGPKGLKIADLIPKTVEIPTYENRRTTRYNHGGDDLNAPDDAAAPWGQGAGEFGRLQDYIKIEKIGAMVDGLVGYPSVLAYRRIGGFVNVRVVLDERGQCDWSHTNIKGNRSELRFYILSVLKTLCRGDAWHRLPKRKSSNLDISFHFNTFSSQRHDPKIIGNVILFDLPGYQQKGEWRLGPIKGNILVPLAVSLNPQWIMENWNALMGSDDPVKFYREQNKKPL